MNILGFSARAGIFSCPKSVPVTGNMPRRQLTQQNQPSFNLTRHHEERSDVVICLLCQPDCRHPGTIEAHAQINLGVPPAATVSNRMIVLPRHKRTGHQSA